MGYFRSTPVKPFHHSTRTGDLSESISRHLNMYALAAGAGGVGLLAWAQPAEAKIVYTPANVTISGKIPVDLNHDGITDFTLSSSTFYTTYYAYQELAVMPYHYGPNAIVGIANGFLAGALPAGAHVGKARQFFPYANLMARIGFNKHNGHKRIKGQWANGGKGIKNHYLGLKFFVNGEVHYGWARLKVVITSSHQPQGTLTGYAFETIAGKPIITGSTNGPHEMDNIVEPPDSASRTTPLRQPTTLGMLALGAPGLSIWRREESADARSGANLKSSG
jgi:hypothetical protein